MMPYVSPNSSLKNGPTMPWGRFLSDVADLLANLIPDVGHISALYRAFEGDENRRRAGNGIAADVVETRSFLELLLYPICDLLERIRYFGAGPYDLTHHSLNLEISVLHS